MVLPSPTADGGKMNETDEKEHSARMITMYAFAIMLTSLLGSLAFISDSSIVGILFLMCLVICFDLYYIYWIGLHVRNLRTVEK
jgi:hypothetical protein